MLQNAKALLAHHPNLDIVEHEGWTAMASSVLWKERGETHYVKTLIEAGANYLITMSVVDNLLHLAAQYVGISTSRHLIECKPSKLDPNAE